MRVVIIYAEKYKPRAAAVMKHEASAIAENADQSYVVEQGEMELPALGKQRRVFSVIRFERIIREVR